MAPPSTPHDATPAPTSIVVHGVLSIDARPGPRQFQGVWIEHDKARWIVDYRAGSLWRSFDRHEVIVTGYCYVPFGEAIRATHFAIEHLRLAKDDAEILGLGPERTFTGVFSEQAWPVGTKLAGTRERRIEIEGTSHVIAGAEDALPASGTATVVARAVDESLTYAATTGGPKLWIISVHEPGWAPDPGTAPTRVPCP